jgi:hypothetical protein
VPTRPSPHDVDGRRTVSAGQVIAVALVGMLLAAFLNADSLVQSIEGQSFGRSRSMQLAVARPIRTISHWTGLDLPRKLIDDTFVSHPSAAAAVTTRPRPSSTTTTPVTSGAPVTGPPPSTTTTTIARRVPTAQQPLKVWLAGDSLMGTIAESFIDKTAGNPLIKASQDFRIGTGLARPDVYDWPGAIAHEMATVNPDVVILVFGANDDQDMVVNGHRFPNQSPEWQAEYARRVNRILDATADGTRQVLWLGVPAVRRPRLNQTKDLINAAVRAAAATHPNVTYVDTGPLIDGPGNSFTTYLAAAGKSITVRESDGIHITLAGAGLVTPVLLADIGTLWKIG